MALLYYWIIGIIITGSLFPVVSYTQGCNDAGFCTIGDMKPVHRPDSGSGTITISEIFGLGEKNTLWFTAEAEVSRKMLKGGKLGIKLPYHLIVGGITSIQGPGDMSIYFSQLFRLKEVFRTGMILAMKIPVSDAAGTYNGQPLPMAYQPSQGTWDIIGGINLFHGQWRFSVAFQHNLNENRNEYFDTVMVAANQTGYFPSRRLDRGDDLMMRLEKEFNPDGKIKYYFGALPIYRLQRATIMDSDGKRISLDNSSGLTLNINAGANVVFLKNGKWQFYIGFPVITREVRPDGLTRTVSLTISYQWLLNR